MVQAKDGKDSFPGKYIQSLSCFSFNHPKLVLGVSGLLVVFSIFLAYWKLEFRTHRDDMISDKKWCQQNWKRYLKEFGQDDDLVVLALGGEEKEKIAALDYAGSLFQENQKHFDRVFWKVDLRTLQSRALLFLSPGEIEIIIGHLANMSPLLEFPFAWNLVSLKSLVCEAHARIKQMESRPTPTPADMAFLNQFKGIVQTAIRTLEPGKGYANPWTGLKPNSNLEMEQLTTPRYLFSQDRSLAVLLARPAREAPGAISEVEESVNQARIILAKAGEKFPNVQFGLTGLPVLEADEMAASQSDSARASLIAMAGVLLLYIFVFRSWRFPFLTIFTLTVGTLFALGWLTLTVGHLNLLSATFAVMLIGLGDYGVLWITSFSGWLEKGEDKVTAIAKTAMVAGPGILTAACTSALAFFATMLADFQAVAEMGWIAGWGILFCALSCFTALPSMLVYCSIPQTNKGNRAEDASIPMLPFPRPEGGILAWLQNSPKLLVAAGVVLFLVLAFPAWRSRYDHNLLKLQSPQLDSVAWEKVLLEKMPLASWHAVTFTATPEEALQWKKKFEAIEEVFQVTEVASLLPGDQEIKKGRLEEIQHRLRLLPSRGTRPAHAPPDLGGLRNEVESLTEKLKDSDQEWKKAICSLLTQFDQSLGKTGLPLHEPLKDFEDKLTADLLENLHQLKCVANPVPIRVEDIPAEIRERYLSPNGQWLLRIFARDNLWEYSNLKNFVDKIQTIDSRATGKPFTTLEGLQGMQNGFFKAGFYSLAAIVAVLFFDFRKGRVVGLTLLPLLLGSIATLGILVLSGVTLNPANMIGFPILAGVGIDNAVHVLHDRLAFRGRGTYRIKRETFLGIFVAGFTTVLGFAALVGSRHAGLASLGLLLSIGVSLCMFYSVVWLPALLQLFSRYRKAELGSNNFEVRKAA